MMTMYRLRYKDGSLSAWSTNREWIEDCAKSFNAEVESRVFNFLVRY